MKKSQKEKKKLLAKQPENAELTRLKKEVNTMLGIYHNPYVVFAPYIMERFERTHIEEMKPQVTQFMDNYYLDFYDLDEIMEHPQLKDAFDSYLHIVQYYYLLTTTSGQKEFKKIVQWLPTESEQETLLSWPDTYIISLFYPIVNNDNIYFQDLKDQATYEVHVEDRELIYAVQEKQSLFLALLLPTDDKYILSPLAECKNFDNPEEILSQDVPKIEWESELFYWYRANLSDQLNLAALNLFDEDFETEYYSAERFTDESDTEFAERLLQQDPMFENFPYILEVKQLLVKVIQTFPQLFFAQANVFPLLETLKILFTDIEIEPENDQYSGDSLSHFWLLLILEYLPKEVERMENFKVNPDDWTDNDDLDFPF